jgi:quinol monooxygenase YgiN
MKNLTVIAKIKVKPECMELVKKEIGKILEPVRKEEGCLQYDLHQDNADPSLLFFYENWESEELLQKHLVNANLVSYRKATEGCIESVTLNKMTLI